MVDKADNTTKQQDEDGLTSKYANLAEGESDEFVCNFKIEDLSYLLSDKIWKDIIKHEKMVEELAKQGYARPSKIQRLAIPILTNKKGILMVAQAQNGSGKTLSFLIPSILKVDSSKKSISDETGGLVPQVLIIEQQREVANQVYDICRNIANGYDSKIKVSSLNNESDDGHIVISTPTKFEEYLLKNKKNNLKEVRLFIIDEADQILGTEISSRIVKSLLTRLKNPDCSIGCISATFTDYAKQFINNNITGKEKFEFAPKAVEELNLTNIQQYYYKGEDKLKMIEDIVVALGDYQVIIFANTRSMAHIIYDHLKSKDIEVGVIMGQEMKPIERDKVIKEFRERKILVLITTNLLARGFDERNISLVINTDIPVHYFARESVDLETYLHRIGRTGRFGDRGIAVNILKSDKELKLLDQIRDKYKSNIREFPKEDLKKLSTMVGDIQSENAMIKKIIEKSAK